MKQWSTQTNYRQRRQNQNSLPSVAMQPLWRILPWLWAHSQGTGCCRFVSTKRPSILQGQLETEWNSWISTSIEKSTWGTSYKGISAHACHMTIIKLLCEWKLACAITWETYYCDFCNQKQLTKIYSKSCSSCTNTIITINQDNKHPLKVSTPWI